MDFVATKDFWTPLVRATGQPHKPTQIVKKQFKKGEIISGEIKTAFGKPSFILHRGVMMIPLSCVKQVVVKDIIVSNADGDSVQKANPKVEVKTITAQSVKNRKYIDGIVLGAIAGFGGTILAEKQGWIKEIDKKTRIYGTIIGAVIGCYAVYRLKK